MRITYATLSADNPELNAAYDAAVTKVTSEQGRPVLPVIAGRERETATTWNEDSPIDTTIVVARVAESDPQDVTDALTAAREAQPGWARVPWRERHEVLLRAADLISTEVATLSALLAFETGKNRLEALGEVEEAAEFFRYYGRMMDENDGFITPLGRLSAREENRSVLKPVGAWGVIAPFNYPMALTTGPTAAALLTGNTVVIKPSSRGAAMARELVRILHAAGVPPGAVNLVPGGDAVGAALVADDRVDGLTFTGSHEVGMSILRTFSRAYAKPTICEMGGKNPTIVSRTADPAAAAIGVSRSAFGFSGQKCSACSRVLVADEVHDEFMEHLEHATAALTVGNPLDVDTFMGPVIDDRALDRFDRVVEAAAEIIHGGRRITTDDLGRGRYVEPTIATAPRSSSLWKEELFLPFLLVDRVKDLDEAVRLANDTKLGLTAGFFGREVDEFLDGIEAGCVYVNRSAGATTGAWPDIQSFGGWKGSGTTGRGGGGPHYLQQYLREQSHTIVHPAWTE